MDITTIIGAAFMVLFAIAGYLESSARKSQAEEINEIWREIQKIKDAREKRNERVNEKFSQIEMSLLDRINNISNAIARLVK